MKLRVTYELNISPENEPWLLSLASQYGWSAESGIDAKDFINERVTKPEVKLLFERIVEQSIRAQLGLAGKATADAVMVQYQSAHTVNSVFTEESEQE